MSIVTPLFCATAACRASRGSSSALKRMRHFLMAWLNHIDTHRDEARQVYLHSFGNPGDLLNKSSNQQRLFAFVVEMVKQGQARGEIRDDMPDEHLAGLISSVYQMVVVSFLFTDESLDQILDSAWRFVLDGVQGKGG